MHIFQLLRTFLGGGGLSKSVQRLKKCAFKRELKKSAHFFDFCTLSKKKSHDIEKEEEK